MARWSAADSPQSINEPGILRPGPPQKGVSDSRFSHQESAKQACSQHARVDRGLFGGEEAPIRMFAASTPGAPKTGLHHRGELYVIAPGCSSIAPPIASLVRGSRSCSS